MAAHDQITELKDRMQRSIIGQEQVVERLLLTLLCNGNVLVEGLPGLAKTRAVKGLAKNLESDFSRIQFTPDLLPADITGSEMYLGEEAAERFVFQPGPIFANIVLADEVNRAPAKVQAALLEAMEERQITVAGTTHTLPPLFMVMATQNPIEQEGTYPLPEAQMDRFLMHVYISYPDDASEKEVIRLVRGESSDGGASDAGEPIPQDAVFAARDEIAAVEIPEAPVGGTLFRVLFLTGALLFIFTLVVTTAADVDRAAGRWWLVHTATGDPAVDEALATLRLAAAGLDPSACVRAPE